MITMGVVGWCDDAGYLSVPGRPTNLDNSRRRVSCAFSRYGVVWIFFSRVSPLSSFTSLWETVRYRLKYCLKGPLNPKQLANQYDNIKCTVNGYTFRGITSSIPIFLASCLIGSQFLKE